MAYSDYGGYAYRNGERVETRSDATLSPEGIQSTPGQWPGWTLESGRTGRCFHVLLGDGPIFVGLYKQSSLSIHRLGEEIDLLSCGKDIPPERIDDYGDTKHLNTFSSDIREDASPTVFEIDGHKIEAFWRESDNYYLFVKLTQPDGTVWKGFSGYGVGAGLEDADYGHSTQDCEDELFDLFA